MKSFTNFHLHVIYSPQKMPPCTPPKLLLITIAKQPIPLRGTTGEKGGVGGTSHKYPSKILGNKNVKSMRTK